MALFHTGNYVNVHLKILKSKVILITLIYLLVSFLMEVCVMHTWGLTVSSDARINFEMTDGELLACRFY